ncbi:hypothetical protein PENTCL1PPCAC_875, partial [Pristionchus entomophagus]
STLAGFFSPLPIRTTHLPYIMAFSSARKVALIMSAIDIVFALAILICCFISMHGGLIFLGLDAMVIPILGISGILCKNTCLMMVWIFFTIMSIIGKIIGAILIGLAGGAFSLLASGNADIASYETAWQNFHTKNPAKTTTEFLAAMKTVAAVFYAATALLIISAVFEAVLTHFYFKTRKEVKQEEMREAFGGMGGMLPPSGSSAPPPSTPSMPSN